MASSQVSADARCADLLRALGEIDAVEAPPRALDRFDELDGGTLARHERTLRYFGMFETPADDRFSYLARLRQARVFILGLGGAGSWVAYQLLMCGIGHVAACDGDTVEASNLNRTALVTEADIGRSKAEALADRLTSAFPEARIDLRREHVAGADRLVELAEGSDVLVGVADTPPRQVRLWVARAGVALEAASVQASSGRVGPFHLPGRSSCAGCLLAAQFESAGLGPGDTARAEAVNRYRPWPASALVVQPAAFSALLTLEVVRYLSGIAEPATVNRVISIGPNLVDGRMTELFRRADCLAGCGGMNR
jgi:hypothetical protein